MPRINLPDGRWVDLRLPTTDEWLTILDDPDADPDDDMAGVKRVRVVRDALNAAFTATSWDGKPSDLDPVTLTKMAGPWLAATQDDAIPPASGTGSGTTELSGS